MIFKKNKNKIIPAIEQQSNENQQPTIQTEQFNNTIDTLFFYTNDKQVNSIDDAEIIQYIIMSYPEFIQQTKDSQLKKIFLEMLDNKQFILKLLEQFDLTIYDFFKLIYKNYSSLFNALFIKKVKAKLQLHDEYAI